MEDMAHVHLQDIHYFHPKLLHQLLARDLNNIISAGFDRVVVGILLI